MSAHPVPQLTGTPMTEWQTLVREPDAALREAALLGFARRLESEDRLAEAAEVYAALPAAPCAAAALTLLTGGGPAGQRFELLLRRFAREAADPRTIAPMFAAASLAGLVKTFSYGRLLGGTAGAWLARPLPAQLAATGLGFVAEVPAFVAALRFLRPSTAEASGFDRELAAAALSLGSLQLFGFAGAKLTTAFHLPLTSPAAFAGLYAAHAWEERLGWRPPQDAGGRAMETLAAFLSLQVGAHLGGRLLGPRYQRLQVELTLSLATPRALPDFAFPFRPREAFAGVLQMSGKDPLDPGSAAAAQEAEAKARGYVLDRPLSEYRSLTSLSLMGDLLKNIERRLTNLNRPLRLLELGAGKGVAARALKARFGDRLQVETLDRYPLPEGGDRHYQGSWPETEVEGEYDLILSIFGPHAHHEGKILPMLQRSLDRLAPDGEFLAALTPPSLSAREAWGLRALDRFATLRAALDRGVALRLERVIGAGLFYARRLGDAPVPLLEEILNSTSTAPVVRSFNPQRSLRGCDLRLEAQPFRLSDRAADRLTAGLDDLGLAGDRESRLAFAQGLLDDYVGEFTQRFRRAPRLDEVERWMEGRDPSAIWQPNLLIDALLRSPALVKKFAPPAALGLGFGLLALLEPSAAWAGSDSAGHWQALGDQPALVAAVLGVLAVTGWKIARVLRARQAARRELDSLPEISFSREVERRLKPGKVANDNKDPPQATAGDKDPRVPRGLVPKGWTRRRRWELDRKLGMLGASEAERDQAAEHFLSQALYLSFPPSELQEAAVLMWELAADRRLSRESRDIAFMTYRNLLGNPEKFRPGSPEVYREALRLRTLFSAPDRDLDRRVQAADAYGRLQRNFDLHSKVGHGEAGKGRKALEDFLESGALRPGRRHYFTVDSAKSDLELRMHHAGIFRYPEEEE